MFGFTRAAADTLKGPFNSTLLAGPAKVGAWTAVCGVAVACAKTVGSANSGDAAKKTSNIECTIVGFMILLIFIRLLHLSEYGAFAKHLTVCMDANVECYTS